MLSYVDSYRASKALSLPISALGTDAYSIYDRLYRVVVPLPSILYTSGFLRTRGSSNVSAI